MLKAGYVQLLRDELIQRLADDWETKWKPLNHGREFINFGYIKNKNSLYAELKDDIDKALVARFGLAEAAERSISADSIRRVLDERWQNGFSDKIKEAISIYLSYDSWDEFKDKTRNASDSPNLPVVINQVRIVSIIPHPEAVQDWWQHQRLELAENPARRRRWWVIGAVALLVTGYGAYRGYDYWRQHRTFSPDELARVQLKVLSRTNRFNPCVATFAYNISALNIDSAEVFFDGSMGRRDEQRQVMSQAFGTFDFSFYKPGIHTVELRYGRQSLKTLPVIIESDGWVCWYQHYDKISTNFRKKDFYTDGLLFLHPDKIIDPVHRAYNYVHYRNVHDFGVSLNDCTIEYRAKNSPDEFGISCYEILIHGEDSRGKAIAVSFSRKGCDKVSLNGSKGNDFRYSWNPDHWHIVRLKFTNNQVQVYLDGRLIRQHLLENQYSQLTSLNFDTKGSGKIDYVRVYDEAGKLAYSDDFDKVPASTIGGY